jgi:hypothetical protein
MIATWRLRKLDLRRSPTAAPRLGPATSGNCFPSAMALYTPVSRLSGVQLSNGASNGFQDMHVADRVRLIRYTYLPHLDRLIRRIRRRKKEKAKSPLTILPSLLF